MSKKRVVMKDVADRAKVHQTTVSLALNNDPRIAVKTRERIQQIAQEMGYVPDPMLRSLVSYRKETVTKRNVITIALIFDISDPIQFKESEYLPSIKEAVLSRGRELGYNVQTFIRGVDFLHTAMLNRVLKARGIQGIVFGGLYHQDMDYELDWDEFSLVKIGAIPIELEIDTIRENHLFSIRKIMRKLKDAGYQRPAMAGSIIDENTTRNGFHAGFLYAQQKHFLPENHIPYYEFKRRPYEEINEEIYQWLRKVKPDAFMSYWNNLIDAVYRLNIEDGHPCRFVCVEGDRKTIQCGGIRNNYRKIAETAVEQLVLKMQLNQRGIPDSPTTTLIETKWCDLQEWPPNFELIQAIRESNLA